MWTESSTFFASSARQRPKNLPGNIFSKLKTLTISDATDETLLSFTNHQYHNAKLLFPSLRYINAAKKYGTRDHQIGVASKPMITKKV